MNSDITREDIERSRKTVASQLLEILRSVPEDACITCGGCGRRVRFRSLYRCYYCGVWFCEACAPGHFGGKRPERAIPADQVSTSSSPAPSAALRREDAA